MIRKLKVGNAADEAVLPAFVSKSGKFDHLKSIYQGKKLTTF